jgi:hypothetical protein
MQVSLRPLVDADLDAIYEQMKEIRSRSGWPPSPPRTRPIVEM